MRFLGQSKGIIAASAVTGAVAIGVVVAYAAADAGSSPNSSPLEQFSSSSPGPDRFARADGLDPAEAKYVFTLANGFSVGIVENDSAKCLIRTQGAHSGDMCASTAAIAQGHGISVSDECGSSGGNLMEIVGLAPEGAASALLRSSDGTSQAMLVSNGAFKFDGRNPAQGAPYPTGVEWVTASGASVGTAALPVEGDRFCLPT